MNALIAKLLKKSNQAKQSDIKDITALQSVTQQTAKKIGNHTSKALGREVSAVTRLIVNGLQKTKSECLILKLEDMQEKKEQKARIPLKSGKNLKKYTVMYVLTAKRVSRSLKTISCLYQKVAQTTLRTFSHYAEIAIARSGLSFNIYEHGHLLEANQ